MQCFYKGRYLKRFDRFPRHEPLLIAEADRQLRASYATRQAPHGLRIKLLYASGPEKIFEARASQSMRIVWAERSDVVSLVLVGLHDEVQRSLRSLR